MIMAIINGNDGQVSMNVSGSVQVLTGEFCLMIYETYKKLAEDNKDAADSFKFMLQNSVKEDFLFAEKASDVIAGMTKSLIELILENAEDE